MGATEELKVSDSSSSLGDDPAWQKQARDKGLAYKKFAKSSKSLGANGNGVYGQQSQMRYYEIDEAGTNLLRDMS